MRVRTLSSFCIAERARCFVLRKLVIKMVLLSISLFAPIDTPWSSSGSRASITGTICGPACTCLTRGSGHYTVRSAPRPRCLALATYLRACLLPCEHQPSALEQLSPLSLCAHLASISCDHCKCRCGGRAGTLTLPRCRETMLRAHSLTPHATAPFGLPPIRHNTAAHPLPSCSLLPTHSSADFVTFLFFLLFVYISKEYAWPHLSLQ